MMNSLCPVILKTIQGCIEASPEEEVLRETLDHLKLLSALCDHYHNNLLVDEIVQILVKNTSLVISPRYFSCFLPSMNEVSNGQVNLTLTLEKKKEDEDELHARALFSSSSSSSSSTAAVPTTTASTTSASSSASTTGNAQSASNSDIKEAGNPGNPGNLIPNATTGNQGSNNGNGSTGLGSRGSETNTGDENMFRASNYKRLVLLDYSPLQQLQKFAQPYWDGVRDDVRVGPLCHMTLMEMIEEHGLAIQKGFNDILRLMVSEQMMGMMDDKNVRDDS